MKQIKLATITVRDIQTTKTVTEFDRIDNRIRKSWVLQMPASVTAQLKVVERNARFELYRLLDETVRSKWVEMMRNHREDAIKNGAKLVRGTSVLEKEHRIDTDELLIEAGRVVVFELLDGKIALPSPKQA